MSSGSPATASTASATIHGFNTIDSDGFASSNRNDSSDNHLPTSQSTVTVECTQLPRSAESYRVPSANGVQAPVKSTAISRMSKETPPFRASSNMAQSCSYEDILRRSEKSSMMLNNSGHHLNSSNTRLVPERDNGPLPKAVSQRAIAGPTKLTVQSTPVKSKPAMISSVLEVQSKTNHNSKTNGITPANLPGNGSVNAMSAKTASTTQITQPMIKLPMQQQYLGAKATNSTTRTHTHDLRDLHRVNEYHSSSDENRSSGHASMSDTGHGSSSPGCALGSLPEEKLTAQMSRSIRSRSTANHPRPRHRATPAKIAWSGSGIEDIKNTIQQLTLRSQTSVSTYSSLSAGSESSEPVRHLGRYSSLETVNTNVTNADEFVWVDSHNRLVELQHPPWSSHCIIRVIKTGRCRDQSERVLPEAVPRLGYLLQRALVRIAREVQRLSSTFGFCSKHEVAGAFKIVLCSAVADSSIKACLRAAAMFAVPGDGALKQSKSARAGLQLPVGRFHRWMADARLGRFIHEYAAIYLCAGIENLLEEILMQCLPSDKNIQLSATGLEHAIAASGDLWGLLQPYAHLNAGRVASGALTMPRWASASSIGSGSQGPPSHSNKTVEPCLLTTCVGSIMELRDLVLRAQQKFRHNSLSSGALKTLFYFMRCSQLEYNDTNTITCGSTTSSASNNGFQELCYERAYVVLPPLVEWIRVASAHADYRHSILIDKDDIMQTARLLLPGVDCPPRPILDDEEIPAKRTHLSKSNQSLSQEESNECGRRATCLLAFRLVMTGRPELFVQASALLPTNTRYDTFNHQGLTPLMVAAILNDEIALQSLLEIGADPNLEVPRISNSLYPAIHPETQHWTALTFAACRGNYQMVRMLLERGANVEGGAKLSEDKCTLSPLQVANGSGALDVVSLLLSNGANAFLSTQIKDSLCFSGSAQRGCFSPISVAACHGQRVCMRKLLSHPLANESREVLSLEEMLAEGDPNTRGVERPPQSEFQPTLNKTQIKGLQEAMYHSAENSFLDITVELRALGVPWTLHCWMHTLAAAHELRLDGVIDQLLQDFLQVFPDEYSSQFVTECLPLLFNIFRSSRVSL